MNHQSLRLTPSNSPFFKNTTPRSPTKTRTEEAGLRLRRIIGTTTASVHGFDVLCTKRQFAYCAGSAAVVATVDEELQVTQRFFRARPTAGSTSKDGSGAFPGTPTPSDARSRALGHVRDHNIGGSPLGGSRDWSDSPSAKTTAAKDRVKAATSVALSPNGRWVALGETGYKPRVLLFSNAGESSENPVCALAEHTFGVQALSFSPDSRYLASLGTVNDGFLYVWSIDERTGVTSLHSSNKCTVAINHMVWVGRALLTIGLRFVKVWRPGEDAPGEPRNIDAVASFGTPKTKNSEFGNSILSPKQKVLAGKNSLLGEMLDCNFLCALRLDNDSAVVCSESGEIAVLDDLNKTQTLRVVAMTGFPISAARVDKNLLHIHGRSGASQHFDITDLKNRAPMTNRRDRRQTLSPMKAGSDETVIATGDVADVVVEIDSQRNIRLKRSAYDDGSSDLASHQLPAHNDVVLGVHSLASQSTPEAAFFTFAGNGAVRLWSADGSTASNGFAIPVESSPETYDQTNELRAAAAMSTTGREYIVAGDRYGTLTLLDLQSGNVVSRIRAHSAEIAAVTAFERPGVHLVATCSKDRTVQLFLWRDEQLRLSQTLDEHAAAVNGLLVTSNGERLLSYSQDRTVIVRDAILRRDDDPSSVVLVMTRSITLKSSPTSICPAGHEDEILVSSMDRSIGLHNIKTGQAGFSFKCADMEGGEAVSMSKIAYEPSLNGNPAIIGISGSDKSVRIYSEYGSLIARDWGHTEGITDLAVLRSKRAQNNETANVRIASVAADSTIFVWDTQPPPPLTGDVFADGNGAIGTASNVSVSPLRPPLRKVLSFSELSRLKREKSIEEGDESPTSTQQQASPQRLRKKTSRMSMAPAPKLEPAFRGGHARRSSLRKRSPSPPSPRTRSKDTMPSRKPSLGMSTRSKSSENVLSVVASPTTASTGLGSLTDSTESATRTLRAYRKKLSGPSSLDDVPSDIIRDLQTELRLVAEALGQQLPSEKADDAAVAKVLEEASEKIVKRLDERIKERVEDGLRRSADDRSSAVSSIPETREGGAAGDVEAVVGALAKFALSKQ